MNSELLDLLSHELGEIYHWEQECPGVYYLSILPTIGNGGEFYAVLEDAPISQEVRAMGQQLEGVPVLVYLLEEEDGAWAAVSDTAVPHTPQQPKPHPPPPTGTLTQTRLQVVGPWPGLLSK